ncbi:MAG: ribokinase [Notoacmeibacter sp.]|nr:ribokinase [Notoacmeibacter sp.]MCC0032384.1 ribokinase [Brucellaceae bacterium]
MITVIGSVNLDLIATVDRLPGPGETVSGTTFSTAPGGKGANQALAAARAGASVRMVGAVGADGFAGEALALLRPGGVGLSGLAGVDAPTGTALILVGGGGENMIAVVPGANARVTPAMARDAASAGGLILLQHEIPLQSVAAALDACRASGGTSLLNIAPWLADAAPLVGKADIVIANETEFALYADAAGLLGATREAQMANFVHRTGRTIIVTLGADGVIAMTPEGSIEVASPKIEPVDTVGAGDTFCGYLAAGLEQGLAMEAALRLAAVAGSLACLKPGAQPAIPHVSEVRAALGG